MFPTSSRSSPIVVVPVLVIPPLNVAAPVNVEVLVTPKVLDKVAAPVTPKVPAIPTLPVVALTVNWFVLIAMLEAAPPVIVEENVAAAAVKFPTRTAS